MNSLLLNRLIPIKIAFGVAVLLFLVTACTPTTSYQSIDNTKLSSNFSVQDQANLVQNLSNQLASDPTIKDALNGSRPTLLVDTIRNKTGEHIDTQSITDTLQTTILSHRLFKIINRDNLDVLRKEQQLNAAGLSDSQHATQLGRLWGVKFVLYGNFSSIVNYAGGNKNTYYKLSLFLQNIETGEVIWVGEASVNKVTS